VPALRAPASWVFCAQNRSPASTGSARLAALRRSAQAKTLASTATTRLPGTTTTPQLTRFARVAFNISSIDWPANQDMAHSDNAMPQLLGTICAALACISLGKAKNPNPASER